MKYIPDLADLLIFFNILISAQALVAHAYNPSYSGGRDQQHLGSEPALANSL
jgi:hypothetical protein